MGCRYVGNRVLKTICKILTSTFKEEDIVKTGTRRRNPFSISIKSEKNIPGGFFTGFKII